MNTSHTECYIDKSHPNAFYQADLKEVLENLDAQALEICGVETQYCVDSTVKLGYSIQIQKGVNSAWDSKQMTGEQTVQFYEDIWEGSFVTFID